MSKQLSLKESGMSQNQKQVSSDNNLQNIWELILVFIWNSAQWETFNSGFWKVLC